MEKKKRRRSIRNLRRQSINSFCEDSDIPNNNDSLMALTIANGDTIPDVFGTVWLETKEESLKEKRKNRRSTMLLQTPILNIDYCSPEIETLRHDPTVASPQVVISPELIKIESNEFPVCMTPNNSFIVSNSFNISTNSLDIAFVGEITTPVLSHLNTSQKKVYPVTPDVGFDFFDNSPMLDITSPCLVPVVDLDTPETTLSDDQKTMTNHLKNTDHFSSLLFPNTDNQISNINTSENIIKSGENKTENNDNPLISQIKPIKSNTSPSNYLTNSSSHQSPEILVDAPKSGLIPLISDNSLAVPEKESHKEKIKLSEESDETAEKIISPSFTENLASGAMGLFNSLVRKISIKRRKSQKKTPKRLKKDNKNVETFISKPTIIIDESVSEMNKLEEIVAEENILDLLVVKELVSTNIGPSNDADNQAMDMDSFHTESSTTFNYFSAVKEENKPVTEQTNSVLCVEMTESEPDNFNMKTLADSINSSKENQITKRKSKRKSAGLRLINYCEDSDISIDEETDKDDAGVGKSRRNRRKSLEVYQSGLKFENMHSVKLFVSSPVKQEENIEEIYLNKNFRAPLEKTWETIFESPNKARQFVGKKRFRRVIDFEGYAPAKFKRRLQKAYKNGWNEFSSKSLTDNFVQSKLSTLYTYLDTPSES